MKNQLLGSVFIASSLLLNSAFAADYQPGAETSFTLIKQLTIKKRNRSIYIQGNIATRNEARIDQYNAVCLFAQHSLVKIESAIKPQKFNVVKTSLFTDAVTNEDYAYKTLIDVVGELDNKKYTIECGYWGSGNDKYLTRDKIQDAIKVYFKISP